MLAVWCNRCARVEKYPIPAVIERLDRRGLNGRAVGIRQLAGMMRRPCPSCGAMDYDSRPDRPAEAMGLSRAHSQPAKP